MNKFSALKKMMTLTCVAGFTSLVAWAQPANDNCSGAIAIVPAAGATCTTPVSGTTSLATASTEVAPDCGGTTTDDDVWYSFVATSTTHLVSLSNISEDMVLAVYSGTCGSLTELGCADDPEQIPLTGLTIGSTYYCRVWTYSSGDVGTFDICVADVPPPAANDECANAIALSISGGPVTSFSTGATESLGDCASSFEDALDTWYKVTADNAGDITITAVPNGYDIVMEVFSGACGSASLSCVDDNFLTETYTIVGATANQTYYLRVYDFDGGNAEFTLTVTGTALPVTMDKLSGRVIKGGYAQLDWNTFSEQNNKGFSVQRSDDGKTFNNIGWVSSTAAQGNSNANIHYSYTDNERITGKMYYRLAQTDIDGRTSLSNTIALNANGKDNFNVSVKPNPVKDVLTLSVDGTIGNEAKVSVRNINGQTLKTIAVTDAATIIPVHEFQPGVYFLNYIDGRNSSSTKFVKQ